MSFLWVWLRPQSRGLVEHPCIIREWPLTIKRGGSFADKLFKQGFDNENISIPIMFIK